MGDDERIGRPRSSRWPWVVGGVLAAVLLLCVGIVGWSLLVDEEASTEQAAPPSTEVAAEDDEGGVGIVLGEDDPEVGRPRRLFTRVLDGDVEVRANVTDHMSDEDVADLDTDGKPLWCTNRGWLEASVITPDSIAYSGVGRQALVPPRGVMQVGTAVAGADLVVVVAVQAPLDAQLVRVAVPGGGVDQMEPVEGMAVLTATIPGGAEGQMGIAPGGFGGARAPGLVIPGGGVDVTVQIVTADGEVVDVPMPGSRERSWWSPEESPECNGGQGGVVTMPPPPEVTLPEPGDEQPADPAAAREEIGTNFALLYSLGVEEDLQRFALIDDPSGVPEALDQVRQGSIIDTVDGAIIVTIDELVFTSASEAHFLYTLEAGTFTFSSNLGRARLIDDVWKITRGTYCQDLGRAGGVCGI